MAQGRRTGEKNRPHGGSDAGDARQLPAGRASALATLELALGLACPALGWAYLHVVSAAGGGSTGGDTPAYELLLLGWLACAAVGSVLGVTLQNAQKGYNFGEALTYGIFGGIGFLVAIVLFASVREKMEFSECPKSFEGFPIALVAAGLIALSFMGFSGLKIFG